MVPFRIHIHTYTSEEFRLFFSQSHACTGKVRMYASTYAVQNFSKEGLFLSDYNVSDSPGFQSVIQSFIITSENKHDIKPPLREEVTSVVVDYVSSLLHSIFHFIEYLWRKVISDTTLIVSIIITLEMGFSLVIKSDHYDVLCQFDS